MMKEIFINMEKEVFTGDVLDIGFQDYGIVYNLLKKDNDISAIEYINSREDKTNLQESIYDNCVMLFSLSSIWLSHDKKKLLKDANLYLKDEGFVHIWDIDKGFRNTYNANIKVVLPGRKIREIRIRDFNIFKNCSKENTLRLVSQYFHVVDFKAVNNIYYIKGKKKGCNVNEGFISSS